MVIDNMQRQIDVLVARGRDSEAKCVSLKKNFDDQIATHSRRLFDAEAVQRNTVRESQNVINKLSTDIETLKAKHLEELSATKMNNSIRRDEVDNSLRIVRLEEEVKERDIMLTKKDEIINEL